MDFSQLTYEQILSIADELQRSSTQMETILSNIKSEFNKVGTDEVWSGTAASQTKSKFDELSSKFPEFSTAINDCCKHLREVVANYKSVDQIVSGEI